MNQLELKTKINELTEWLEELGRTVDEKDRQEKIRDIEAKMLAPDFWSNAEKAQKVIREQNDHKSVIAEYHRLCDILETLNMTYELVSEGEEMDLGEAEELIREFEEKDDALTIRLLLDKPYDKLNAILEFHPGAGGTESQDWAQMLFRMYTRWAEQNGYKVTVLDYLDGEEAGLKSATILVAGPNAYGYLKAESGVHRLVRISPFDASARRHTSFASVSVVPEIDDSIDVDIDEQDIRVDVYRSSGNGGQGVNTTDSAVRITHLPTKLVVTCQNERSQIQNRETALRVLKGKLYQLELEKKQKELDSLSTTNVQNAFGSQIRSYVFQPYTMVKDHRTSFETAAIGKVMDGDLNGFINAYLRQTKSR
ncbi:MAG TPA: peptide chain release factor 2 [Bacillota bacterium]|nr:peptide chain release factor 2 [Bacillota bacterium]HPF42234.1 peptide chain release factor 2 [Bacillota bacterium]HPJ85744.1 peptide chain release factor 2 [Bacillota bacterium]HPQ61619.1 peptide chain release factor 2 [Bacillota bacterium]HRX91526.1 peptide chain release factor 2 [Candidatus Izemoplasmatales bacterium]